MEEAKEKIGIMIKNAILSLTYWPAAVLGSLLISQ